MRDKIFTFGPNNGIVGILTEPEPAVLRPDAPVIIASNVGMNHRVGPYRSYVELSRELAAAGYPMFRFDLSGLGDSAPRQDDGNEFERSVLDVKDAMEVLTTRAKKKRFIQLGFCSGVDSAHAVAREDERVVGAIFIEGYSFPTRRAMVHRYGERLLRKGFWKLYARQTLARLNKGHGGLKEAGEAEEIYSRVYPERESLVRDFEVMSARGTNLLFVYSGFGGRGFNSAYAYPSQFYDVFPELRRNQRIEVEYMVKADHTFSVLSDRTQLFDRLRRWLLARY